MDQVVQALWAAALMLANGMLVAAVATPRVVLLLSESERRSATSERASIVRVVLHNTDRGTMRGPLRLILRARGRRFRSTESVRVYAGPSDRFQVTLSDEEFRLAIPSEEALDRDPDASESLRGNKTWVLELPMDSSGTELALSGTVEMSARRIALPMWLSPLSWVSRETRRVLHVRYPRLPRLLDLQPVERYAAFIRGDIVVVSLVNLIGVTAYGLVISVLPVSFDWYWDGGTVLVCCVVTAMILVRIRSRFPPIIQGYLEPKAADGGSLERDP